MRHYVVCFVTILSALRPLALNAQDDSTVLVDSEQMSCVVQNISAYLASEDDPVFVFMPLCPDVEPAWEDVSQFAENTTMVVIKEAKSEKQAKSVVVLSKAQLECIRSNPDKVIRRVEEPKDAVLLDLISCDE